MGSSNKHIIVLNFCGTPTKHVDYVYYSSIRRSLTSSHKSPMPINSSVKNTYSLIRVRQDTILEFITLLENIIVNIMYRMQQLMNSNHEKLIRWFLRELAKVIKQLKFRD